MQNRAVLLFALAATLANAQVASLPDLSLLPQCAQKSATTGIGATDCQLTNIACICQAPAFIRAVGTQIATSCSPEDQKKALAFANSICQPLGVTIPSEGLDDNDSDSAPSAAAAAASASAPVASPSSADEASSTGQGEATSTAGESAVASASESGVAEPPYPIPSNGSNSTYGNSTALPFTGVAARSYGAMQAGFTGFMLAVGFVLI